MELDKLKKGFFGYKKASVYEYIVFLEEEFSAKLMEKDAQIKETEEKYLSKIQQMEEEMKALRQKCDAQNGEQTMIAAALVEAKRFAEQLKKESSAKEEEAWEKFEKELKETYRELKMYQEQIADIRKGFQEALRVMDEQLQEMEENVETAKSECPGRNMTLFERKEK